MKRAPFIGAGVAMFLAGCGGRTLRALPGVATYDQSRPADGRTLRLVPEKADAVPADVLSRPIVGEARRFDGSVAPLGWMLCKGQTLQIADNRHLFAILGTAAGGDGKTTFKLPNGRPQIIAAGGVFPATSAVFAQSGRHMSPIDSLGDGARMAAPKTAKPPSPELLADRRLIAEAVHVKSSAPVPVSRELADRIRQAQADARSAAISRLSPANQSRLQAAVEAAVAGRATEYAAVVEMAGALTDAEATALIEVNEAMTRSFQSNWTPRAHPEARLEAGYFLLSVAFTPEQKEALAAHGGS